MTDQRPPAPAHRRTGGMWSWLLAACALVVAAAGLGGAAATLRVTVPPPSPLPLDRYESGAPLADRLVIVFAPRLDARGVAGLHTALRGTPPRSAIGVVPFTVDRPAYTAFEGVTMLALAGNLAAADSDDPTPAAESPDNLVRSLRDQGREVLLFGPPAWRELFEPPASPALDPTPSPAALLTEAAAALDATRAPLAAVYLAEVGARELTGGVQREVAALGTRIGDRDSLLILGGGGGAAEPLHGLLSGPPVKSGRARRVELNDIAPTCAVIAGGRYPAETRGRIAWPLLTVEEPRKAAAAAALARQRTTLALRAQPFGVPLDRAPLLKTAIERLPAIDVALQQGQYAYAYQLASSSIDEADRALEATVTTVPILPPRRVAWSLFGAGLGAMALALVLAALNRAALALAGAALGGAVAAGTWFVLVTLLRAVLVPDFAAVVATLLVPAALGIVAALWLGGDWQRMAAARPGRRAIGVEILVLLAGLPVAVCAYRYGLPWRLRWEETASLFRWRSALLAPAVLLIAGYGRLLLTPVAALRTRLRRGPLPGATPSFDRE